MLAWLGAPASAVFAASAIAVVPLAAEMGAATEALAVRTGPAAGGLLNATFGNAAELIVAIVALRAGFVDLVKASLAGSILGNLLLILGLVLVAGGARRPTLTFNRTAAGTSGAMLLLAVAALVIPALFALTHPAARPEEGLHLSAGVAVLLGLTYLASLVFSLVTHRQLFHGETGGVHGPVRRRGSPWGSSRSRRRWSRSRASCSWERPRRWCGSWGCRSCSSASS